MALKKAKIKSLYEGETFELQEAFDFPFESYERCGNGKGEYKNRGKKKILNIKYTPDFIGEGFIIETKGRANESFPLRWKMFKKLLTENKKEPLKIYRLSTFSILCRCAILLSLRGCMFKISYTSDFE